ncbi:hypothetical protein [Pseudobythopirellula maris]|nr:hypothetical protein [Pseudobythopirellula maris]
MKIADCPHCKECFLAPEGASQIDDAGLLECPACGGAFAPSAATFRTLPTARLRPPVIEESAPAEPTPVETATHETATPPSVAIGGEPTMSPTAGAGTLADWLLKGREADSADSHETEPAAPPKPSLSESLGKPSLADLSAATGATPADNKPPARSKATIANLGGVTLDDLRRLTPDIQSEAETADAAVDESPLAQEPAASHEPVAALPHDTQPHDAQPHEALDDAPEQPLRTDFQFSFDDILPGAAADRSVGDRSVGDHPYDTASHAEDEKETVQLTAPLAAEADEAGDASAEEYSEPELSPRAAAAANLGAPLALDDRNPSRRGGMLRTLVAAGVLMTTLGTGGYFGWRLLGAAPDDENAVHPAFAMTDSSESAPSDPFAAGGAIDQIDEAAEALAQSSAPPLLDSVDEVNAEQVYPLSEPIDEAAAPGEPPAFAATQAPASEPTSRYAMTADDDVLPFDVPPFDEPANDEPPYYAPAPEASETEPAHTAQVAYETPASYEAPAAEPSAFGNGPIAPTQPANGSLLVGAPNYGPQELAEAMRGADEAARAFAAGSLDNPEQAAAMGQSYASLCRVARVLTLLDDGAMGPDAEFDRLQASQLLKRSLRLQDARINSRRVASAWVGWSERTDGGVFFAGKPIASRERGSVFEYTFALEGGETVPVLSEERIDGKRILVAQATEIGVIGVVVENPAERVAGYIGDAPRAVWCRKTLALGAPRDY